MSARRRWTWVPAVLFAAGLFALLFRRAGDAGRIGETLAGAFRRPGWLAAGVALFSVSLLSGLLRWYVLLRTLRLPVPFPDALRLYATGHCFNVLGPGATGGDLVKGAWIAVRCPGRRAEAVASIAAERLIGLFAMSALLAALTFVRADFFDAAAWLVPLRRALRIAFCVGALGLALLAAVDLEAIARRLPAAGPVPALPPDAAARLDALALAATNPPPPSVEDAEIFAEFRNRPSPDLGAFLVEAVWQAEVLLAGGTPAERAGRLPRIARLVRERAPSETAPDFAAYVLAAWPDDPDARLFADALLGTQLPAAEEPHAESAESESHAETAEP